MDGFCVGGELQAGGTRKRLRGKKRWGCMCTGCAAAKGGAHKLVTSQPGFAAWAEAHGVSGRVAAVTKSHAVA